MKGKQEPCHCFIKHAKTIEERDEAIELLEYSRRISDNVGITLAMAKLGPCHGVFSYLR